VSGGNLLTEIVASKRARVEAAKRRAPLSELRERIGKPMAGASFFDRLRAGPPAFIAEIKRGSPSRGLFAPSLDAAGYARDLAAGGADALSVITEEDHFFALAGTLKAVREAVSLPLLKKDFLFDPWQIYDAKLEGASLVLLITSVVRERGLSELLPLVHELEMDALVEVHDENELDAALAAGARIIGINNRDLRDFSVNLAVTERLVPRIPKECVVITESGIHTVLDVARLSRAGVHGYLIGESLIRHATPRSHLEALRRAASGGTS
jgi:indole-3-glycerol phosphate synthase